MRVPDLKYAQHKYNIKGFRNPYRNNINDQITETTKLSKWPYL